jgi:hypothetical protein
MLDTGVESAGVREVVYFDEFFKDGRKVFVGAVVEGVEGFGALKKEVQGG